MGLHNRPYMRAESPWRGDRGGDRGGGGGLNFSLPRPARAVKVLLIINAAVYVLQMFFDQRGEMSHRLGVTVEGFWQVWRYVTFQFLHSTGSIWHIAFNMLGLYMLGSPLEQHFGTRRFVRFYLTCGVVAGIAYVIIGALGSLPPEMPIIGASGGVYGIVLACAVFFPQFRLIFLFFPVPIRPAAMIIFGVMILKVLRGLLAGDTFVVMSDVAHLGGAVAAAVWIWGIPTLRGAPGRSGAKPGRGAWRRKMEKLAAEQAEIDRILDKVHEQGLNSLTGRERKTLHDVTMRQQRDEQDHRGL